MNQASERRRSAVAAPSPRRRPTASSRPLRERNCSVGRTLNILSDGWAFLVLRESYFGATRFQMFQSALGLPRQTLTRRLRRLTAQGLLVRTQYSARPRRFEYRLTEMGIDMYPVMLALLAFGDRWLARSEKPPIYLVHNPCGCVCRPMVACSHCRAEVNVRTVRYRDGPGAGLSRQPRSQRHRRSSDPAVLDRGRPSSVARTLKAIGDRWSFMVIREAFFGVRRFDELQSKLGIAPNILTDRLQRLVAQGFFARHKYQDLPPRFDYRLTEKGKDLYGPLIAMLRWGDRWLADGKPPLILAHLACGGDFAPTVVCDQCGRPLAARDMSYKLNYTLPAARDRAGKPGRPIVA
jgi:DNA-binding HxlR family transcriptional regulator